jgi:hypothetical protein
LTRKDLLLKNLKRAKRQLEREVNAIRARMATDSKQQQQATAALVEFTDSCKFKTAPNMKQPAVLLFHQRCSRKPL